MRQQVGFFRPNRPDKLDLEVSINRLRDSSMSYKILRLPIVKELTGLSRSTIYLRISKNEFPAPISLGGRAVGWVEADINVWLAEKIEASRGVN
jgi:prophage regulatory protein